MEKFKQAYQATFGNITQACIAADISYHTYSSWRKKYQDFADEIDNMKVDDVFVDWVESQLQAKIRGGDTASIIFALKTKGRKRGWEERLSIENNTPQVVFNIQMTGQQTLQPGSPGRMMTDKLEEIQAISEVDDPAVAEDVYGVNQEGIEKTEDDNVEEAG